MGLLYDLVTNKVNIDIVVKKEKSDDDIEQLQEKINFELQNDAIQSQIRNRNKSKGDYANVRNMS